MNEMAEHLKSERLRQGLTPEAVSERAHISISTIEALEEGSYERIGTPLLIRSFLRAYCSALGIDPLPLLERFEKEIQSYDDRQESGIKNYGNWSRSVYGKRRLGIFPVLMLVVVAAGALYGGVWLWKSKDSLFVSSSMKTGVYPQQELPSDLPKEILAPAQSASENKADTSSDKEANRPSEMAGQQPAERKEIPVAVNAPECAVSPGPNDVLPEEKPVETSQAAQSHRLEVEAIQKTWIKVVIDNKNTQNVVLKPGEKREWEAGETMRVELGNAAGVQMKWDGEPLGPMGKPGRAVRFTLPNPAQPKKPETPQ